MRVVPYRSSGFTIVELLVVIVVIGLLAAVSIVAYNGIQKRAIAAEISSDLANASQRFKLHHVDHGSYPTSLAPSGSGTTYQVSTNATANPEFFCITGTKRNISYSVSNTSVPAEGACTGHAANGISLSDNLVLNPSFETDLSNWMAWNASSGTTIRRITSGSGVVAGAAALEINVTTANQSGAQAMNIPAPASKTYTSSVYVTLISGDGSNLMLRAGSSCGTQGYTHITGLVPNQPKRVSHTWNQCATANSITVQVMRSNITTGTAVLVIDGLMVEEGTSATTYSD